MKNALFAPLPLPLPLPASQPASQPARQPASQPASQPARLAGHQSLPKFTTFLKDSLRIYQTLPNFTQLYPTLPLYHQFSLGKIGNSEGRVGKLGNVRSSNSFGTNFSANWSKPRNSGVLGTVGSRWCQGRPQIKVYSTFCKS